MNLPRSALSMFLCLHLQSVVMAGWEVWEAADFPGAQDGAGFSWRYVFGGRDANGQLSNSLWQWNGTSWKEETPHGEPIPGRHSHAAFGTLFIHGGVTASGETTNELWFRGWDERRRHLVWTRVADMRGESPRLREHTAVLVRAFNGFRFELSAHLFGGIDGDGQKSNRLYRYDPSLKKWSEEDPLHTALTGHLAFVWEGKMWVVGGQDESGAFSSDVHVFTPGTGWSTPEVTGEVPPPRSHAASFIIGPSLHLVGGIGAAGELSDHWILNLETLEWWRYPEDFPTPIASGFGFQFDASSGIIIGGVSGGEPVTTANRWSEHPLTFSSRLGIIDVKLVDAKEGDESRRLRVFQRRPAGSTESVLFSDNLGSGAASSRDPSVVDLRNGVEFVTYEDDVTSATAEHRFAGIGASMNSPVGFRKVRVKAGIFTFMSSEFVGPIVESGVVTRVAASFVSDDQADFTGSLEGIHLHPPLPYSFQVTSGNGTGFLADLKALSNENDGTSLLLDRDAKAAGVQAGDSYEVRQLKTISEVFSFDGSGDRTVLQGYPSIAGADLIWSPVPFEDNSYRFVRYFFHQGSLGASGYTEVGRRTGHAFNAPIRAHHGLVFQRRQMMSHRKEPREDLEFFLVGYVPTQPAPVRLHKGFNWIGRRAALGLTLGNSGLATALASGPDPLRADVIWLPDGRGNYRRYFYRKGGLGTDGFRLVGGDGSDQGDTEIPSAYLIQRRGDPLTIFLP